METTTISAKYQISIPKKIRQQMHWEAGQKLVFIPIGKTLRLVPQKSIEDIYGLAKGADTKHYRDRDDRV